MQVKSVRLHDGPSVHYPPEDGKKRIEDGEAHYQYRYDDRDYRGLLYKTYDG